jgi:hypothetical protein
VERHSEELKQLMDEIDETELRDEAELERWLEKLPS